MQQMDKITAVFKPKDLTTLRPEAFNDIGYLGTWQAAWIIESGIYTGQWAMIPLGKEQYTFGWVPEEDLEIK
jgi:hypothetical protein